MCANSRQNSILASPRELAPQFASPDKASYASDSSAGSTCSGGSSTRSDTKEPLTETKQPTSMKERLHVAQEKVTTLKHAAEDKANAVKDKAKATRGKALSKATDIPHEDDANPAQKETMQMSQAFVQWLIDGGGKRNKNSDSSRQTVLKTVEKFSGAQVTIDEDDAVMGKKKVDLVGTDEQRHKAKEMMQRLASRGQVAEGSLMGMVDAWGEMGGIDDHTPRSTNMIMSASRGYDLGNAGGYESSSEPAFFRNAEAAAVPLSNMRRNMMKKDKQDLQKALAAQEATHLA